MDNTLKQLVERIERRLTESPLAWSKQMEPWSSELDFRETIRANDQGYYLFLNALVAEIQPKTVLELGTCQGGSALMMLLSLPADAHLVSYDLGRDPEFLREVRDDTRLHLITGDSRDSSHFLALGLGTVDLLFIDTEHSAKQVQAEWDAYRPLMSAGASIVMDDLYMNDVLEFWSQLSNEKIDTGSNYHQTGFGIFRT